MSVIDFHSHILPGIDDGSESLEMTQMMLRTSAEQGIDVMVATPHFYPTNTNPDVFLEQRARAVEQLHTLNDPMISRIYIGAEVAFFNGISQMEQLEALCIQGTELMLLEMPFGAWSHEMLREVERLCARGVTPIIAHLDRYLQFYKPFQKNPIKELKDLPVYIQINVDGLLARRLSGTLVKLFRTNRAHLLGSDCHNANSRPAGIQAGRDVLRCKLGENILSEIDECGSYLLGMK